jgi:hypothetical protein
MRRDIPDFKALHAGQQVQLGEEGARSLLDAGRAWNLAPILKAGGAVLFPHTTLPVCGHQIAAAVHACLDSGARRVLVLGVLHALTPELEEARVRVANGGDPSKEPTWGIQGPGQPGREEWRAEFSLAHFLFLWDQETQRRGIAGPERIVRYPYLAGGRPELLPGMAELQAIVEDAVVVATMDPFHHGIGYGDPPEKARGPEAGGLDLARQRISEGLVLLGKGDHLAYQRHCVEAKSDGRDVGQVLRFLLGPLEGRLLDLIADDMTGPYNKPAPTWVAGALSTLQRIENHL